MRCIGLKPQVRLMDEVAEAPLDATADIRTGLLPRPILAKWLKLWKIVLLGQ